MSWGWNFTQKNEKNNEGGYNEGEFIEYFCHWKCGSSICLDKQRKNTIVLNFDKCSFFLKKERKIDKYFNGYLTTMRLLSQRNIKMF